MARFRIQDIHTIENAPTSPGSLRSKLGEMIVNSTTFRAKIESIPERFLFHASPDADGRRKQKPWPRSRKVADRKVAILPDLHGAASTGSRA